MRFVDPSCSEALGRAVDALSAGRVDEALAAARAAVAQAGSTEQQVRAQMLLGHALAAGDLPERARAAWQCALALAVDLPPGHPLVVECRGLADDGNQAVNGGTEPPTGARRLP